MRGPNATSTHGQRQTHAAAGASSASASAASRKRPRRGRTRRAFRITRTGGTIDRGPAGRAPSRRRRVRRRGRRTPPARRLAVAVDGGGAGAPEPAPAPQLLLGRRHGGPADGADMTDVWYTALGEKDAVTLTHEELRRLHDRDFLNDSLRLPAQGHRGAPPEEQRRRYHFFNTFFKRLMIATRKLRGAKLRDLDSMRECYRQVARWTKGVNLFDKDYVFVPINEHLHWSLVVLYKPGAWAGAELARREGDEAKRKEKEEEMRGARRQPPPPRRRARRPRRRPRGGRWRRVRRRRR